MRTFRNLFTIPAYTMLRLFRFFLAALMLFPLVSSAKQFLHINHPKKPWYGRHPAAIQNASVEVWPAGAYARVELTVTFAATSLYGYQPNDSLESVLEFELPEGTLVHNSWLWLNPTVIIQAAIMDRGRAVTAYNTVVARNTDPSLLQKLGPEQYQLNVFPLLTTYPRKVRIFYATPFEWSGGAARFALPTGLLSTSHVKPDIQLTVHHDAAFSSPNLLEGSTTLTPGVTPSTSFGIVPAAAYGQERSIHLSYNTAMSGGALLAAQPSGGASPGGTYQVVVDPSSVGGPRPPRYLTVIFNHNYNTVGSTAFTQGVAMDHVRSTLLTLLSPTDSFAFFYVHNNTVMQAGGAGWHTAHPDSIQAVMATVPPMPTGDVARLEDLLKASLQHAASKPTATSGVVVMSNITTITQQWMADTTFNRVVAHLGGVLPTRIDVINAATTSMWAGGSSILAGDLLWTKFALATGGTRYRYSTVSYGSHYNAGPSMTYYFYDLPARKFLKSIVRRIGHNTSAYDVAVPVTGGLTFGWHDLMGPERWSEHSVYAEVGKYVGTLNQSAGVIVQYMGTSGFVTDTVPVTIQANGADTIMRESWTYNYITRLLSLNNTAYQGECIDSSIRARVLCPLTAFLALETGDTVGVSQPGNGSTTGIAETEPSELGATEEAWMVASPNPFIDAVSIAFRAEPTTVEIFDATGRRVWSGRATGKRLRWDGTDAAGRALPPGLYIVRAHFADRVETLKLQKR